MRIALNRREDTAYIYLTDFEDGDAARQFWVSGHDIRGDLVLDFDKKGRLLGIEVKYASSALPERVLDEAELT